MGVLSRLFRRRRKWRRPDVGAAVITPRGCTVFGIATYNGRDGRPIHAVGIDVGGRHFCMEVGVPFVAVGDRVEPGQALGCW